jgi:hypothetical protein
MQRRWKSRGSLDRDAPEPILNRRNLILMAVVDVT